MRRTHWDSPWARNRNRESYPGEAETQGPGPLSTGKLGFLSIFKITQVSSHFEALNSESLSSCQRNVRPPLIMRQGARAFSKFSKSESDLHISCEKKDQPEFDRLQGNPAFFQVITSHCPFPMRKQTLGPAHIPKAERILLLRCLWKVGIPVVSKLDNQLSFQEVLVYTELSSSFCVEFGVPLDLGRCPCGISGVA